MVGLQQFNLRWNNYTSNILQVFSEHLSSESLVDVTLSCQGRFIKAHKIILSACSPYFQEVFANHADKHPVIILKGIKYEDLQSMIKFMYNGEIKVQEAQLDDLLAAAETLQVKGLSNVRSKYERGEIKSLNPAPKPASVKSSESATTKKESPMNSIKATVALFAPTATTTRAPNAIPAASDLTTSTPTSINRSQFVNDTITAFPLTHTGTMTRIPASTTFHATKIGTLTPTNGSPALAIATLLPSNTLIPVNQTGNWIRCTSTGAPTSLTFSPTNSTAITVSTIGRDPKIGALISSTSTTPSLDTPIITCVTGNFVDPSENQNVSNDFVISATDSVNVSEKIRLPKIYPKIASNSVTTIAEKKSGNESQPPRVRKRRKMSHTVNELAKETVFASNGTILLEPDDVVLKSRIKTRNSSTKLLTENSETSTELEEVTVRKMRVKIQTKNPQESLLIKDKEKNSEKIPRPPNAFMIFANEWRKKLAIEYPKENNKKISVRLGIMWKGLSIKSKETYYKLAKKADEDHKERYPGYFYSPKEARIRKSLKHHTTISKDSSTILKNLDDLQMLKAVVNGEEREIVQFTDSDEYDEDEDFDDCEEEEEYDDDVILDEYTDDEDDDNPEEESESSAKRKDNASHFNKINSSKT